MGGLAFGSTNSKIIQRHPKRQHRPNQNKEFVSCKEMTIFLHVQSSTSFVVDDDNVVVAAADVDAAADSVVDVPENNDNEDGNSPYTTSSGKSWVKTAPNCSLFGNIGRRGGTFATAMNTTSNDEVAPPPDAGMMYSKCSVKSTSSIFCRIKNEQ
eukprot:742371-Ditylum_brightwellii.AAC.1